MSPCGREWGLLTYIILAGIDWSCGTPPTLPIFIGWAERLSRWWTGSRKIWKCSEISVPHQDVDVPTKSYRRMKILGTFWNEIRQHVERNQNEISNDKDFYTKYLTKSIDSERFWMKFLRSEKNGNVRAFQGCTRMWTSLLNHTGK